jgi:hypothetical protein
VVETKTPNYWHECFIVDNGLGGDSLYGLGGGSKPCPRNLYLQFTFFQQFEYVGVAATFSIAALGQAYMGGGLGFGRGRSIRPSSERFCPVLQLTVFS